MSLLDIFKRKPSREERNLFPYIAQAFSSPTFSVEKNVCVDSAVSIIANTIGVLPLNMYQYTKRGVQEAWSHPIARLLKDPAVEESAELFYRTMLRHILLKGFSCIYKHRNSRGEVVALELVDPNLVRIDRFPDGRRRYTITGERGGIYTDREIICILYPEDTNLTVGLAPCQVHRTDVMLNDLLCEYIKVVFEKGVGSRLMVTLDKEFFKPGSAKNSQLVSEFQEYFNKFVLNRENMGKVVITPPGSTISKLDMPNLVQEDVLALYKESCKTIWRMYNIPEAVMDAESNRYNQLEAKQADFLRVCILPLCKHIAQTIAKSLLDPEDRNIYFLDYSFDEMLETDTVKKSEMIIKQFHAGVISLSEARRRLHLQAMENDVEGDTHWIPANLVPLTEENIRAYLAKSKAELGSGASSATSMEDKMNEHSTLGDDKE